MSPDRYTVISADCHAGADLLDYRPYLAKEYHDEFDAWAATYVNPYEDLMADTADKNWNSERRLAELEQDGIVAEVLFPNTIRRSSRPAPDGSRRRRPRSSNGAGRACAPTTAGSRTSARRPPAAGRASSRSS